MDGLALEPGDSFGRYRIEALLGQGGMGSVYRAVDTKLERRVALKLLRRAHAMEGGARTSAAERLLREARAVALIEHPNAVAVYDVGEVGEVPYIAMELVVGRSLRTYIGDAGVVMETRLRWLADIGRALAAAHARGVVHRDVKPENVMVREDGVIKVLDFGIAWMQGARVASDSSPTTWSQADFEASHTTLSLEGALVGTPRYMSPEQLQGRDADGRSDQFAWGVMAYELIAGNPPWPGDTMTYGALLDVLEKEPPRLRHAARGVAPETDAVVHRAMCKGPAGRFHSMEAAVEALCATFDPRGSRVGRRGAVLAVGVVAVAVALAGTALYAARASSAAPSFHATNVRRITYSDSCEEYPSFTPDAESVVFDEVRGSGVVIVARDLATGSERVITDSGGWDFAAEVSPDGREIAFQRAPRDRAARTMVVDIDGKIPPRAVCEGELRPSFSPDGKALWCGEIGHATRVDLATGKVTRKADGPSGALLTRIREMRDGRLLALTPGQDARLVQGLALFERDGSVRWLAHDDMADTLDVTPDERSAIVVRVTSTGSRELVAIPLAGGAPVPVGGVDIVPSQGARFAPNGKALVWSTCHEVTSLARVNEQGALVPLHETHAWKETAAAPVPGTNKLIVLSERGGTNAPWVVDRDEREPPRELRVPGSPRVLSVSPDGRLVAFAITGRGIFVASVDGQSVLPLTTDASDGKPRFLRDGRTIVFVRASEKGTKRIFSVDARGGEARPLLDEDSSEPAPSPTDDRVAYLAGASLDRRVPMILDLRTGRSERLSPLLGEGGYTSLAFSGDGRRLGFLGGSAVNRIVEVDATTGAVVRAIDAGPSSLFKLSYDGNEPIVGRSQWTGNIWIADGQF